MPFLTLKPPMSSISTIAYTKTDEAPALATHSLLPILRAFATGTGIDFELKDISLAGRILAHFPDALEPDQRVTDALSDTPRCSRHVSTRGTDVAYLRLLDSLRAERSKLERERALLGARGRRVDEI